MKKILISLLIISLGITLSASSIAHVTAITGFADIKRDSENIKAILGSAIEQKDTILTKENSKLQVIFKDETIISIGKNSEFSVQEYLFEDNQTPIVKFGMIRGALRTITGEIGNIAPQKFRVATKTATIGIRGTNFSIFVDDDGSTQAFCTFGAISVSIAGITHTVNQGFYIQVSSQGKVEIKEFTSKILKSIKEKYFTTDKSAINHIDHLLSINSASMPLDNTRGDSSHIIIRDVNARIRDAITATRETATRLTTVNTDTETGTGTDIGKNTSDTVQFN